MHLHEHSPSPSHKAIHLFFWLLGNLEKAVDDAIKEVTLNTTLKPGTIFSCSFRSPEKV